MNENRPRSGPKPRFGRQDCRGPRPSFGPRSPAERRPEDLWIYGLHSVAAALANPRRKTLRLLATLNGRNRLVEAGATLPATVEEATPRELDRLLGADAVHQGIALQVAPLDTADMSVIAEARLLVVLDQVTDPHNVGAIMRSAVAFGAGGIVTTGRHSPVESGVLAKAASGAADLVPHVEVGNLARGLEELRSRGFTLIGLDSDGDRPIDQAMTGDRIALVLGAEGKGLRKLTKETCDVVARLEAPGAIRSLNVSNAAAISLYLASRHLGGLS